VTAGDQRALAGPLLPYALRFGLLSDEQAVLVRFAHGEPILSPTITRRLMDRAVAESGARARALAAFADLTPREREVAVGIARSETNAEIAARLFMSVATVKAHITHILTKLGATNRTQIALLGHDAGLV